MEKLPRDVLIYMALSMDIYEIFSLCKASKKIDEKLCQKSSFWMQKLKKDYPSLDQELIKEKASDLSSGEITINININISQNYENDDGEEETIEIDISHPIFFSVMTPLIEIRRKILNVLDEFFQTISIFGYYSVVIDGKDTKCRDTKYLSGCLDDLNYSSKNINVYLDASEPIDPSDEDNFSEILSDYIKEVVDEEDI